MSGQKFWLWKNFVDGRPEYWAFDNPYPCYDSPHGDQMVLGEPCGYAIFKPSHLSDNHTNYDEKSVLSAIKRSSPPSQEVIKGMAEALKPFADIGIATAPDYVVRVCKSDIERARTALARAGGGE